MLNLHTKNHGNAYPAHGIKIDALFQIQITEKVQIFQRLYVLITICVNFKIFR